MPEFSGQIALVTGASRGLGRAISLALADAGATVILLAKGQPGLEAVDDTLRARGQAGVLMPLDLARLSDIDSLGAAIAQRFGRLDILVGNAAILGTLAPVAQSDPRQWEEVLKINLLANQRLIRACEPLLRATGRGRAVFVTCSVARSLEAFWGPYAASKAALEAMVATFARESGALGLRVMAFDPGVMRTRLRAKAMPGEDPKAVPEPDAAAARLLALLAQDQPAPPA